MTGVVVVGTGQAAAQLAINLRQRGFDRPVTLIGEEAHMPYERPPLSKGFLDGSVPNKDLVLRPASFWSAKGIDVRTGVRVTAVQREADRVLLSSGEHLDYEHLVLATGAVPRRLAIPGGALDGVHVLRTRDDARRLRADLERSGHVVVVGAGFIGLEVAAVARSLGRPVTVLERLDQAMARVVSRFTAAKLIAEHERQGVDVRLGDGIAAARSDPGGRIGSVLTTSDEELPCDLMVMGAGVVPRAELAGDAGLAVDDGIVVDTALRTTDPRISAIGDCARYPSPFAAGRPMRLESVQNAVDQARCLADRLTGKPSPYGCVPWFWTTQYGWKLQIAGLVDGHDTTVLRGDVGEASFSVFCFAGDRLLGVESVNRPSDHMLARALLAGEHILTPDVAADPAADLKTYRPPRMAPR